MAKNSVIKWRKEDEKVLRKAVSDFNKKVKKLSKGKKDTNYLPSEIDYEGTKDLIKTRSELNRVMKSLSRFSGKEAYKKVMLPSGKQLTAWEKKEISYQKASAVRRIKKRMAQIEKPYYKMGNEEYRRLEAELKRIKNVFNTAGKKFQATVSAIENLGSADYEIRRALIYRENYFKMFKQFKNSPYYDEIVKKLKAIQNPVDFYNKIRNLTFGEYLADIKFMYDSAQSEVALNQMARELGIETEDSEIIEDTEEGE